MAGEVGDPNACPSKWSLCCVGRCEVRVVMCTHLGQEVMGGVLSSVQFRTPTPVCACRSRGRGVFGFWGALKCLFHPEHFRCTTHGGKWRGNGGNLGYATRTTPKGGGGTTPAPALDPTTSLISVGLGS